MQTQGKETIRLYRTAAGWVARSESYRELFGTDLLPTAFTAQAAAAVVAQQIATLNPDATVIVSKED